MKKILIIDDDAGTTTLVRLALKEDGYEVVALNDSAKAFDVIANEKPDLILLDYMMPGMNGLSVLNEMRKDQALAKIPVIFFTVVGDINTKMAAFEAGVRDYITKPVHHQELLMRVKTLMGS
jgi:two-component system phosphate regulon response regulator PhoB